MQNFFLTAELKTMANLIRRMAEQCPAMLQIEGLTAIQCIVLDYLYENGARDVFQRDLEVEELLIFRRTLEKIKQNLM